MRSSALLALSALLTPGCARAAQTVSALHVPTPGTPPKILSPRSCNSPRALRAVRTAGPWEEQARRASEQKLQLLEKQLEKDLGPRADRAPIARCVVESCAG